MSMSKWSCLSLDLDQFYNLVTSLNIVTRLESGPARSDSANNQLFFIFIQTEWSGHPSTIYFLCSWIFSYCINVTHQVICDDEVRIALKISWKSRCRCVQLFVATNQILKEWNNRFLNQKSPNHLVWHPLWVLYSHC